MIKESEFQGSLIKTLENVFPGCRIVKNNPNYIQGFPDLSVFYGPYYCLLECKRSPNEPHQPNQDYYVENTNSNGGFARFIFPENMQQVISEMKIFFGR
jgi:hypothetical protein